MKSRLGASISSVFAGENRRSIFKSISVARKFTLFNGDAQCMSSLQLQGFERLKQSLHSFSAEDDDFSELGPPLSHGAGRLLKLVTEKPEHFMKTDSARKTLASKSFSAESSPSLEDIFLSPSKPSSDCRPKHENDNFVSRFTVNNKDASNLKNLSSISIENVPSTVNFSQLTDAISIFGKISCASMRTVPNGLDCCDVEFECVESSRRAVSVGGITVRGFHLPIRHLHVPATLTIRIKGISKETADPAIHSMCKSIGALEGLARARKDVVDAVFSVKDDSDSQSILTKLNNTIVDDCQWSAYLRPIDSTPAMISKNDEFKCEIGLQISSHLAELKRQFSMKKIFTEDLEYLHSTIMHLQGQPLISNRSDVD